MEVFALIALVVVICSVSIVFYIVIKDENRKIEAVCKRFNLSVVQNGLFSDFILQGSYKNKPLKVWKKTVGSHSNKTTYTVVEVGFASNCRHELKLKPEVGKNMDNIPFVGKLLKKTKENLKSKMKVQDIDIGNRKFDDVFLISGCPEEVIRKILTPELQDKMLDLENPELISGSADKLGRGSYFNLQSDKNSIVFTKRGFLEPDYYSSAIEMIYDMGNVIEQLEC